MRMRLMPNNSKQLKLQENPTADDEAAEQFSTADEKADLRAKTHELAVLKAEMGPLGQLIGSTDSSRTIAFCAIIILLVFMLIAFVIAYWKGNGDMSESGLAVVSLLGSMVTACIGYIFGSKES